MELEPEQIELLVEMVEAEREIPREHRRWFLVNVLEGPFLEGPDRQRKVIAADLQELTFAGYLCADIHDNYTITPEGRAFYAEQQKQAGALPSGQKRKSAGCSTGRHSAPPTQARTTSGRRPRIYCG